MRDGKSATSTGIPRADFPELLEHYRSYLFGIATRYAGTHPFGDVDDFFQMLSVVLWNCNVKYTVETDAQFHDLLVTGIMNRIASHFRDTRLGHDRNTVRLDAETKTPNGDSGRDPFPLTRTEQSEDFYRAGIFELIEALPAEDAQVVMDHLDPSKRGHLKGARQSFLTTKNALNGL